MSEKPPDIDDKEEKTKPKLHFELEGLIEPVTNICKKLKGPLEEGDFHTIISDDKSGRLPALIMWYVAKELGKENNIPAPSFTAIYGKNKWLSPSDPRHKERVELERKYTRNLDDVFGDSVLYVTDFISSGHTVNYGLRQVREMFPEQNINIACIRIANKLLEEEKFSQLHQNKELIVGEVNNFAPPFYRNRFFTGLTDSSNLFAGKFSALDFLKSNVNVTFNNEFYRYILESGIDPDDPKTFPKSLRLKPVPLITKFEIEQLYRNENHLGDSVEIDEEKIKILAQHIVNTARGDLKTIAKIVLENIK